MPLMDEFKSERDTLKQAPFKKKLEYFWDYYKWHTMGTLFTLIIIGIFIFTSMHNKETVLYTMFFNTDLTDNINEEMGNEYLEYAKMNMKKQSAIIDTSFYLDDDYSHPGTQTTYQKMSIFTATNQLDILGGPIISVNVCMYDGYLCDLRTVLTEEQIEKYEPYFLYSDEKILTEKLKAESNSEVYEFSFPDPTKPEKMSNPVPVAIDVSTCTKVQDIYPDCSEMLAVGAAVSSIRPENVQSFIDFLFEE